MAKMTEIIRERIARVFYRLFLWVMEASKPKCSQRARLDRCDEHIGVACALCSWRTNVRGGRILHSCMVKPPCKPSRPLRSASSFSWLSSSSTSSWSLSTDGDFLGAESGVLMCSSEDTMPWEDKKPYTSRRSKSKNQEKIRDIPPPLTILRERSHWGLESIREDGRLIMNLVSMDNSASFSRTIEEESGQKEEEKDASNPLEAIDKAQERED